MSHLSIQLHHLAIRFIDEGPLLPWLGPALRGLVAGGFKERVCAHPPHVRLQQWQHCSGCPYQTSCPYGVLFEPADSNDSPEKQDAARRPLVMAPDPAPASVSLPGMLMPLRMLVVGEQPGNWAMELLQCIESLGADRGLGSNEVHFELLPVGNPSICALDASVFPLTPVPNEPLHPLLTIELRSPLFLREARSRNLLESPSLADLLKASIRVVDGLFSQITGTPLSPDIRSLVELANQASVLSEQWEPFSQRHHSTRGKVRYSLEGVVGHAVYTSVHQSLVPWLTWGGMLHVGGHRIAGAGGWRTVLG